MWCSFHCFGICYHLFSLVTSLMSLACSWTHVDSLDCVCNSTVVMVLQFNLLTVFTAVFGMVLQFVLLLKVVASNLNQGITMMQCSPCSWGSYPVCLLHVLGSWFLKLSWTWTWTGFWTPPELFCLGALVQVFVGPCAFLWAVCCVAFWCACPFSSVTCCLVFMNCLFKICSWKLNAKEVRTCSIGKVLQRPCNPSWQVWKRCFSLFWIVFEWS